MADISVSFRQCAVIEFLVKEERSAVDIQQRLQRAYGDACMGASSVRRWVKHFKMGTRVSKMSLIVVKHALPPPIATRKELMRSLETRGVSQRMKSLQNLQ
ncbi:hypothetical protein C0J52_09536 [Blattella germanica]|nr:hypothetical protein C0J52_09536 [Blattella germanica]PSN56406.1 hypothetical protein C0J52_09536 [Blattella germanica]